MIALLFTAIDVILLGLFGFLTLYLFVLSLLALGARLQKRFDTRQFRRIALVVPAHNEELSISKTITSIQASNYPKEMFDVVVVGDNCTDRTAEKARALGAVVYERTDSVKRGKGYALRWCLDQLLQTQPPYDAVMVIDADTVVAADVLTVMNFYLENGSAAIQCSDMVAPQPDSWSSEMTRFGFTLYNHVRPLGRRLLGCSAGIRGNGMCFSADTLRKVPWSTYSLNEDLEYGIILLLHGITVDFAAEAKVLATMPANPRNAESQRSRWERGRVPIIKRYWRPLLMAAVKSGAYSPFDALVDLITPPFVNLFAVVSGVFIVHIFLLLFAPESVAPFVIAWGLVIMAGVGHVIIGLYAARADALLYKAFFHIPRYAAWKLFLYMKSLRRPATEEWIRTTRERSIKDDTVNES